MDPQVLKQLGMATLSAVLGLAALFLPYEWNVFRLKRQYTKFVSEEVNRAIPTVIGIVLLTGAFAMLVLTLLGVVR